MDIFSNLLLGFEHALTWQNLVFALIGCVLGTLIGVLPGLGPLATISLLLPFTFGLDPLSALVMLAGIYYGSQYGGSTTAILVNLPGETSSVVTAIDGYQMAQQGRAGAALSAAALSSFFAGCMGVLVLALFSPLLTSVALSFTSVEYFSLMLVGLVGAVLLSSNSLPKALAMGAIGVLIGTVGADLTSGTMRYTFGFIELWDGVDFIVVAVGLFGFTEVISSLEEGQVTKKSTSKISTLWPTKKDVRDAAPAATRGALLGALLGALPGVGLSISSFLAYTLEARVSKNRANFGKGAIEGVAAPEAANNAAAQTAFIPTLALGIPGSATMALILGAMMVHNIQPGPQVIVNNPELFWGLVASMWIGNLMLIVLNLPMVGLWTRLLTIPYAALFPAILMFCCIGVYSVNNSIFDVLLAAGFGFLGYLFRKMDCPPAPLILGLVLAPMLEQNMRRALVLSKGDFSIFVTRPISAVLLFLVAVFIVSTAIVLLRSKRPTGIETES